MKGDNDWLRPLETWSVVLNIDEQGGKREGYPVSFKKMIFGFTSRLFQVYFRFPYANQI
jgi:hypothetical protein